MTLKNKIEKTMYAEGLDDRFQDIASLIDSPVEDVKARMKTLSFSDYIKVMSALKSKDASTIENMRGLSEGWAQLPDMDRDKYQERDGLEGPIMTKSGKVVYYDPKEGSYYDPDTDIYLTHDEWKALDESYSDDFDYDGNWIEDDDFDAEGQQGKALMQLYKDNEHNNYHSENNLLLAKAFGTPKEVNMVELIIKKNQKQGHTSPEDSEWMYKNINKPYYKQLVAGSLSEKFKKPTECIVGAIGQ